MQEGRPSGTAYRVALRRAAHQVFDRPVVFRDPLAMRILGLDDAGRPLNATRESRSAADLKAPARASSIALRAFLVARSRFAEETLAAAVAQRDVRQYVLLGAGLDTFAYRNPYEDVRVFEVDHPDTQRWKLGLLGRTHIAVPALCTHVPVDFNVDSLARCLEDAGFDRERPAVFAWLGVVPYLTDAGFSVTLEYLSSCAAGSVLVMDYGLPRHVLPPLEQLAFDSLAARVAQAGEPFQLFFTPEQMHARLKRGEWYVREDLGRDELNARFFAGRGDSLRCLATAGRMLSAELRRAGA